jgi:hypothetical protein
MFPVWHTGIVPKRWGAAAYVIMIRASEDPKPPKKAAKHEDRDKTPHRTLQADDPNRWRADLLRVLSDGRRRTFNSLCVLIGGVTADIAGGELPEDMLWQLVEEGHVEFTDHAPIFFRLAREKRNGRKLIAEVRHG